MSYDLMVFDQTVAPRSRAPFLKWYRTQMQTTIGTGGHGPKDATGNLRAFYDEMRRSYPPMNGSDAYDFQAAESYAKLNLIVRLIADLRFRNLELLVGMSENLTGTLKRLGGFD